MYYTISEKYGIFALCDLKISNMVRSKMILKNLK